VILTALIEINDGCDEQSAKDAIFLKLDELDGFKGIEFDIPDAFEPSTLKWIKTELNEIKKSNDRLAMNTSDPAECAKLINSNNGIQQALCVVNGIIKVKTAERTRAMAKGGLNGLRADTIIADEAAGLFKWDGGYQE
jgi:hypothetical protein